MAIFRHYRCPDCEGTFKHLHHPNDTPPPDRCPLCNAWVSDDEPPEPVFIPQAPGIRKSALVKSADQVYRAMEKASEERAEEAADQLGVHKSEMTHLKITDLKDNQREGDIAAVTKPTPTGDMIVKNPSQFGFQGLAGNIPNHAPGVGPAGSGHAAREQTTASHWPRAARMVSAGRLGSYTPEK